MYWEFDNDRDNIHLYMESSDQELTNSPIEATGVTELPEDFMPCVAYEMKEEFNNNGFTTRMMNIILAQAQPDIYIKKK
jgi:hypothetical protein